MFKASCNVIIMEVTINLNRPCVSDVTLGEVDSYYFRTQPKNAIAYKQSLIL